MFGGLDFSRLLAATQAAAQATPARPVAPPVIA